MQDWYANWQWYLIWTEIYVKPIYFEDELDSQKFVKTFVSAGPHQKNISSNKLSNSQCHSAEIGEILSQTFSAKISWKQCFY